MKNIFIFTAFCTCISCGETNKVINFCELSGQKSGIVYFNLNRKTLYIDDYAVVGSFSCERPAKFCFKSSNINLTIPLKNNDRYYNHKDDTIWGGYNWKYDYLKRKLYLNITNKYGGAYLVSCNEV